VATVKFRERIEAFWREVHELEKKYQLELSHEDPQGAFLVYANPPPEPLTVLRAYNPGNWYGWNDVDGTYHNGTYSDLKKALGGDP
jgi:hypothetical protein